MPCCSPLPQSMLFIRLDRTPAAGLTSLTWVHVWLFSMRKWYYDYIIRKPIVERLLGSTYVAWITLHNASWLVSGKGQDVDITQTHRWWHGSKGEEEEQVQTGHLLLRETRNFNLKCNASNLETVLFTVHHHILHILRVNETLVVNIPEGMCMLP